MPASQNSPQFERYELTRVALGEAEADIAIINGRIVNVYTGELVAGDSILIKGKWIACVGKHPEQSIGPGTRVIDASGKVLVPGFIDGHTHMDYLCSIPEIVRYALKAGTTTIITECAEMAFRLGYRGVREFLRSTRNQPVKFWFTLPPMGTISPVAREHLLNLSEVRRLLRMRDCVGAGETYWGPANAGDKHQIDIIRETLRAGKKVEGHSAGASSNKLQAYAALGITSDHEPITPGEALERLRLGLSVMIREGEVRQDLEAVSSIREQRIDFRRLAMSTDGIGPWQLVNQGFMDWLVRRAIELGFPPVQAIQMATLNVAEHFNLHDFIGGIAPGRFADIVMIPDLTTIRPEMVISNGRIAVQGGEVLEQPRRHTYPGFFYQNLNLDRVFQAGDFAVRYSGPSPARVRVIDQLTRILTRETLRDLPVSDGEIRMDPDGDIIKVAAIEYVHAPGRTFTGFIRGLGLRAGAVATSTCWDSADLVVAGANEADMALAVNRIMELKGGAVACRDGKILGEAAFPVSGVISEEPVEKLAEKLTGIQEAAAGMGCVSSDIRTTLSVLPTPAIPFLRLCESGLFDVRNNRPVELVADESD